MMKISYFKVAIKSRIQGLYVSKFVLFNILLILSLPDMFWRKTLHKNIFSLSTQLSLQNGNHNLYMVITREFTTISCQLFTHRIA